MKEYFKIQGQGWSMPFDAPGFDCLEAAQKMAQEIDSEGTGWPFDIVDDLGNVIEHHLGY